METLEAIKVTFFQECEELLGDLETGLLSLQAGEGVAHQQRALLPVVAQEHRRVHAQRRQRGAVDLDRRGAGAGRGGDGPALGRGGALRGGSGFLAGAHEAISS